MFGRCENAGRCCIIQLHILWSTYISKKAICNYCASKSAVNNVVSLVSIPLSIGQPYVGPDRSPDMLKRNGLLQMLGDIGWRVEQLPDITEVQGSDMGSIEMSTANAKNCAAIGATCKIISEVLYEKASQTNNFILVLGGDHCIPIGTIPGLIKGRPNTGIVWVDAHADINSPASSLSGNMHGMPVSFSYGFGGAGKQIPEYELV